MRRGWGAGGSRRRSGGGGTGGAAGQIVSATASGSQIDITFDRNLLPGAIPVNSLWSLDGGNSVTGTTVSGAVATLTTASPVALPLSIGYTDPAQPLPVAAPSASNYTIPGGSTEVTNITDLQTQLATGVAKDIYVRNGTYNRATPIAPAAAHRVWAESVDNVIYNFGWSWNNNIGWKMKGGTVTLADAARAADDGVLQAAILNWQGISSNGNAEVTDMKINCGFFCDAGLNIRRVGGTDLRRLVVRDLTDYGVFVHDNGSSSTSIATAIHDLDIANVYRQTHRGAANGVSESGLTIGHEVSGDVMRIKVRNTGWQGIAPNLNCQNTGFIDLDIDEIYGALPTGQVDDGRTGTGVEADLAAGTCMYVEHTTHNLTVDRFNFGAVSYRGFNGEWDGGTPGNAAMNNFKAAYGRAISARAVDTGRKRYGFYGSNGSRDVGISETVFRSANAFDTGYYDDDTAATTSADFHHNVWSGGSAARNFNGELNNHAIGAFPDQLAVDGTPPQRLLSAAADCAEIVSFSGYTIT